MNDQFYLWLLVVGLACGVVLAWLALGSAGPAIDPDAFQTGDERALEARWLADELARRGRPVDAETLEIALELHRDLATGRLNEDGPAPSVGADEDHLPG